MWKIIDVLDAWGMLLSRMSTTNLGDMLQMDPSYVYIPACDGNFITLDREPTYKYHVEVLISVARKAQFGLALVKLRKFEISTSADNMEVVN